jgi:hypothetical protein
MPITKPDIFQKAEAGGQRPEFIPLTFDLWLLISDDS